MVVVNVSYAAFMGARYEADPGSSNNLFSIVEIIFLAYFVLEIVIRLLAIDWSIFRYTRSVSFGWLHFDILLAFLLLIEVVVWSTGFALDLAVVQTVRS